MLNTQEKLFIDKYGTKVPNGYNVLDGGNVNPTYLTSIPVYQFNVDGNLVCKHKSISECTNILGLKGQISLRKHINNLTLYKGYYWSFNKEIDITKYSVVYNIKPVYQFTLEGNFIKRWDSISAASLYISNGKSRKRLHSALNGSCSQSYGYLWSYTKIPPEKYKTRIEKFGKKVNQYDLDFNYITTFNSVIDAASSVGSKCYQLISGCCNGVTHHSFGYIWRYVGENDSNPNFYYEKMGYMQSVDMFDLADNYINTYENMICISEGYNPSLILRCCKGKIKKAYNHIWKFNNSVIKSA